MDLQSSNYCIVHTLKAVLKGLRPTAVEGSRLFRFWTSQTRRLAVSDVGSSILVAPDLASAGTWRAVCNTSCGHDQTHIVH